MSVPPEAVEAAAVGGQHSKKVGRIAALLLVICRLHEQREHISYDVLIAQTGIPRSQLFDLLTRMRREGLVTWDEPYRGSIRPCVEEVARVL